MKLPSLRYSLPLTDSRSGGMVQFETHDSQLVEPFGKIVRSSEWRWVMKSSHTASVLIPGILICQDGKSNRCTH